MRKDRQRSDGVADPVVGCVQRRLAQVLLIGAFQDVVRNIAGARHDLIAVVHGLGDDDRHQAIDIGHLLRIAWLQWRQRRQKLTLAVDEAKHVSNVAVGQLLVEGLFVGLLVFCFGLAPGQLSGVLVVFQMRELSLLQFTIEGQPLCVQFCRAEGYLLFLQPINNPWHRRRDLQTGAGRRCPLPAEHHVVGL